MHEHTRDTEQKPMELLTCVRGAFSQGQWVDCKPQQTGFSLASPTFGLRYDRSLHVPPSEGKDCVTVKQDVDDPCGGEKRP